VSKTVDQRVVEMRFDNKQFESNVQTTMSTLEKLKHSLKLDGASKGLENVSDAAKSCNFSGLSGAVESVRLKFSALEVMAVTALTNITNAAVNAGKKLIQSLAIEPISQGFDEYELKMGSIQTIMMSTGASLEEVNGYLNELNTYADKTIYSFADMTSNIGKFTNAGVKLDDAVMAIQGVSNVAAVSGANANEASRAMYNFAQALSAGYVKLIDWKSIENANMATVEFKTQLLESAVAAGTLTRTADGMYRTIKGNVIDATHNFNDSLQDQWMTTDALVSTLRNYADETTDIGKKAFAAAQDVKTFTQLMDTLKEAVGSGWAMTWEILFGDFEEAKALWTGISNVVGGFIDAQSDARNQMLQDWKDLGGRTALIESAKNAFQGLISVLTPVKEAFREVFPPATGKMLADFTEKLKDLTAKFKLSEESSKNLKNTFKGLFAALDIVKQALSAVFTVMKPLLGVFVSLGGGILKVTGFFGQWIAKVDELIKKNELFGTAAKGISQFMELIVTGIKTLVNKVKEKFDFPGFELFHALLERIQGRMSQVGNAAGGMKSGVVSAFKAMGEALKSCKFLQLFEALWNAVKKITSGIVKAVGGLAGALADKLGNANFGGIIDLLNGLSLGAIALGIKKFLEDIKQPLEQAEKIKDHVIGILDSVKDCFKAYETQLKAGALLKIAAAIAILAAAIVAISLIDSDKLLASLGAITVLFTDLMASMAVFNKISGSTKNVTKSCAAMISMSVAVLILASALKKIGDLNITELATGLVGIAGLTAIMVAAAKAMSGESKTIIKGATQMVIFASAIKILASACKDLSALNWEQLFIGLTGVGVLLAEVSLFMRTAKFSGKSIVAATGIVILASAMKILASACGDFGRMRWDEVKQGLIAVGALLTEIAIFTNLTGNAKHLLSTGTALVLIAASMKILASAVSDFGNLGWEQIKMGLIAMGGALAEVAIAVNLMPKNMVGIGTGLIAVGAALEIIADVMSKLGGLSLEQIGKALIAMGGALAELAIALNLMNGTLSGSAALLVAVAALAVLAPVLSILGAMSWESIAKGLIALAGAFAVIGVAGLVLEPLVPAILGLAGAFALIGAGVLAVGVGLVAAGVGLSAIAVGFTALAAAGTAGATAVTESLTTVIAGIADLIPLIIAKIGEGIIEFCKVIAGSAYAIGDAVKALVLALVDVLVECVPAIADGALKLLVGVLEAVVRYTPQIVDALFQFLIGVLEGIARNLPGLIQAAVDVIMAFFSGIVDALSGIDVDILLKGIVGIGLLSAIMLALAAVAALVPAAMAGVLGMGLVIAELALVLAAIGALAQIPGLSWLIGEGGKLLEGIGSAIGSFIGGIVGGLMSGVSSGFPQIGADLSAFMTNVQPFIDGASKIDASMMNGVKALAETILLLTAADILQGIASWVTGGSSLEDFGKQIVPFGEAMVAYSDTVSGKIDTAAVTASANAGRVLADLASNLPNSGGVLEWWFGENDIDEFAAKIIPFGEAIAAYSETVAGRIDVDAVTTSANAGKILAELAANLPNSGGVLGWWFGENDIDTFAAKIIPFGRAIAAYSETVAGKVDVEAVTASTNAGQALSELASNLPNSGGMVSWFTGDNDIGAFGESLVSFGRNFAAYSAYMETVQPDVVTATANAATSIVELQKSLPKSGGLFSDKKTLASFGRDLSSFGCYFSDYYGYISNIDTSRLSAVIIETGNLISMANDMNGLDTSGMSGFGKALTDLGKAGIDGFIKAFSDATSKVTDAASKMLTSFINAANAKKESLTSSFTSLMQAALAAISGKRPQFGTEGQALMTNLIAGIKLKDSAVSSTVTQIISGALTKIKNRCQEFYSAGQALMIHLIAGIKSKDQAVSDAITQITSRALTAIKDCYPDFYDAGEYLVEGFADGIDANAYLAEARAREMARAAARAAAKELDEHSPSKVGYRIGDYFGVAFVNAIGDHVKKAYQTGSELANSAKKGLNDVVSKIADRINGDIDTQPTIRPVLDLSNVTSGARRLNAFFSRTQAMSIGTRMDEASARSIQNGEAPSFGNTYQFTQNNYSPKALSRLEIYRQTKNQFSAMKEMVNRA